MDLPFKKPKGSDKKSLLPPKKKDSLSKTEQSVLSICKQLKNSIVKDCFIDLFMKEQEENINVLPKKLSPYLNNLSIGEIKLCEDTTHLIDINYFEKKLENTLNIMGLLKDEQELAEYTLDVSIMHCMNVDFHLNEELETPFKHMIRTNLMTKYTTIKKTNGSISCELWYQGRGEKRVAEVDDIVKRETLEMAYEDNLNYILYMMKANNFQ